SAVLFKQPQDLFRSPLTGIILSSFQWTPATSDSVRTDENVLGPAAFSPDQSSTGRDWHLHPGIRHPPEANRPLREKSPCRIPHLSQSTRGIRRLDQHS